MEIFSIFMGLDVKDQQILELLTKDASLSSKQISSKIRIPITTIHNRIKKLKKEGVIKNFTLNIDYGKIGKTLIGYIQLTVNQNLISVSLGTYNPMGRKVKKLLSRKLGGKLSIFMVLRVLIS